MPTKVCTKCSLDLPFSEYYKDRSKEDGFRPDCKACHKKVDRKWRQANPEQVRESNHKWRQANPEQVRKLRRESNRRAYAKNPELIKSRNRQWAESNREYFKEYLKEYRHKNPEKVKALGLQWRQRNPGKVNAYCAKRHAAKRQAVPGWLSESQINEMVQIYETCPKGWHVDHIVPLLGKNVRGLHVPWNLQHLPAAENISKGNKLIEV